MSGVLRIRPGRARDAEDCRRIERLGSEQFRYSSRPEVADFETRPAEAFAPRAEAGELLVAEIGRAPVGFALLRFDDDAVHVEEIDVDPAHQGRGAGAALLDAAAALGKARGARRLTLTTFRAVPWNEPYYRRRGFRPLEPAEQPAVTRRETELYASWGWGPDLRLAMVRPIR